MTIPEREVLALPKQPEVAPLVLETTELAETELDPAGRQRWRLVQILWRYQKATRSWIEMARMVDPGGQSGYDLRHLAAKALRQDVWRELESVEEAAARIHAFLDSESRHLGERRASVMDRVLQQLVWRMVEESGSYVLPSVGAVAFQRRAEGPATHT